MTMQPSKTLLRRLRRDRELTLARLARKTGINVSTLSLAERGLMDLTPANLDKLARYFGVPADKLLRPAPRPDSAALV